MLLDYKIMKVLVTLDHKTQEDVFNDVYLSTAKRLRNVKGKARLMCYWVHHRLYESEAKALKF